MYARPRTIEEATRAMAAEGALAVCGGTDVYPAHVGRPLSRPLVDLSRIEGLRGIGDAGDVFRFGAATTWSDILRAPLPAAFDGLKAAAREVGSVQIQNRGTIAGNLCNASPAADGVPPLLSLDARVELAAQGGRRVLPLSAFITGYRRTALAPGEIVTAVLVPKPSPAARAGFVKLGARRYLVISILMAAAVVEKDAGGRILRAAVAVGAASPVAQRLPELEADLRGLAGTPSALVAPRHLLGLSPIDDVRATAAYRLEAALSAIGEALDMAAGAA
ncbi:xanthine dehydrogenase family protein subunit M [Aestuariivirga litoralis]|uniref:Xanthine dehydrogenase family protein subunit M n=1 Tax=Aestuariivirga litoralis TaxID=2650924 RepID=A0A2W2BWJ2_9HYPH|nr:FAD binding domain-containing protein [Aestuariivirga litoralis]PZF77796.1 xanthine dehydrogenase family protein subunit M [Aestuariivirga litoralis]